MHGAGDSALGFLSRGAGKSWMLQMVERGYEVWLFNNRGVKYSNRNEKDGHWSQKERWNFNWADIATLDVPVAIERILLVTREPKVTVIGHSMGTSIMWYALAKNQDFYAERVHRFFAMASCIIPNIPIFGLDREETLMPLLAKAPELGYKILGPSEEGADVNVI